MVTGEKTGYLRSPFNGNQFIPTTMVATHSGFTLWRMLGSNQRLIVFTTKLILHVVERTGIKPVLFTLIVTVLSLHHLSIFYRHATLHRYIIQSPQGLQSRCLLVRIRLYSSAVDVYTLRCFTHFNDCGF